MRAGDLHLSNDWYTIHLYISIMFAPLFIRMGILQGCSIYFIIDRFTKIIVEPGCPGASIYII